MEYIKLSKQAIIGTQSINLNSSSNIWVSGSGTVWEITANSIRIATGGATDSAISLSSGSDGYRSIEGKKNTLMVAEYLGFSNVNSIVGPGEFYWLTGANDNQLSAYSGSTLLYYGGLIANTTSTYKVEYDGNVWKWYVTGSLKAAISSSYGANLDPYNKPVIYTYNALNIGGFNTMTYNINLLNPPVRVKFNGTGDASRITIR